MLKQERHEKRTITTLGLIINVKTKTKIPYLYVVSMIHSAAASSVISPTPEADGCAFKGKLEEHSSALFF